MKSRTLLVLVLSFMITTTIQGRDLSDTLKSLAPSLMTARHVPGLQIAVFRPGRQLSLAFGTTGDKNIDEHTQFFVGDMSTALVPLLLEEELTKETLSIREAFSAEDPALLFYARFQESIHRPGNLYQIPLFPGATPIRGTEIYSRFSGDRSFLLNLYHSVSGLPPSRSGISAMQVDASTLFKSLHADETPYSRIAFSSEGMQTLLEYMARVRGQSVSEMLTQALKNRGLQDSRFVSGAPEDYLKEIPGITEGYTHDERPVKIHHPYIAFPGIYGMVSNARDIAQMLRVLSARSREAAQKKREDLPFGSYFSYDPSLGGVSGPFHVRKLCGDRILFEQSSRFPGFAAFAAFSPDGRGMVLLANADDSTLLQRLSQRILLDLFTECSLPGADRLHIDGAWSRTLLDWFGGDSVRTEAYLSRIQGTYRPEGLLPRKQEQFAFMNDVRIRLNSEHRLEISGFYDREIPIFLVPDEEPFVFRATGRAAMAGWKLKFIEDEDHSIIGFYTDLVAYQRVLWGESIWGRIVGFAFSIFLFALLILLFYLKKKNYTERRPDSVS